MISPLKQLSSIILTALNVHSRHFFSDQNVNCQTWLLETLGIHFWILGCVKLLQCIFLIINVNSINFECIQKIMKNIYSVIETLVDTLDFVNLIKITFISLKCFSIDLSVWNAWNFFKLFLLILIHSEIHELVALMFTWLIETHLSIIKMYFDRMKMHYLNIVNTKNKFFQ